MLTVSVSSSVFIEKNPSKQECIPAGCVPSTAVAVCWGGMSAWGVSAQGRVSPRGVSVQGGLPRGVCPGGCLPGRCLPGGRGCLPQCMLGYTPPVNKITDACENITLPQLRCGR